MSRAWANPFWPVGIAAVLTAGCMVGPNHTVPEAQLEAAFKNTGFSTPPPQGDWWKAFGDPRLDALMDAAAQESPTARAALARYDLARAAVGAANADAWPVVTADGYGRRQGDSENSNFSVGTYNDFRLALNLSWEVDLWGRVRRQTGLAEAERDAAGYAYQGALLSLRGEVARAYLSLRFTDMEIALLEETSAIRDEAERLMKARYEGGASSEIDHQRAITERESVRAELGQMRATRARYENALAALVGRSAAGFRIQATGERPQIPPPFRTVPSDLLRRRPDLAESERRLAASSERIGLAIASYLPRLSLGGEAGLQSLRSSDLFDPASKLWSLGPELAAPIFQGGRGISDKRQAEAAYREALEIYRDTLLRAVQETEDALGDARLLAEASAARRRGAESAVRAAKLARQRYLGGIADYFEVVDADRTQLGEQRAAVAVDLARAVAATRLIQAVGGGWERME